MNDDLRDIIGRWTLYPNQGGKIKAYVYFISDGEYIKIGKANSIKNRIKSLQTGNARKLFVKFILPCEGEFVAKLLEGELHEYYASKRLEGEWFDIMNEVDDTVLRCFTKKALEEAHYGWIMNEELAEIL